MFKKIRMWFWTRARIIEELAKLNEMMELNLRDIVKRLEELDQEKVYVCNLQDASEKELQAAQDAFERAVTRLRWTAPVVLFLNKEYRELSQKEIDSILAISRIKNRSVKRQ